MPVSSLTWTRHAVDRGRCAPPRRPAATNGSLQATTSARAASATGSSSSLSAPMHEHRRVDPRRAELGGLIGRGDGEPRRPAGERRVRGRHRAVAIAVGLDDGAQPTAAAGHARRSSGDVALDRRRASTAAPTARGRRRSRDSRSREWPRVGERIAHRTVAANAALPRSPGSRVDRDRRPGTDHEVGRTIPIVRRTRQLLARRALRHRSRRAAMHACSAADRRRRCRDHTLARAQAACTRHTARTRRGTDPSASPGRRRSCRRGRRRCRRWPAPARRRG